jgi:type VI secretion system secreted protein Hcp
LKTAEVSVRKQGGDQQDYYKIKLTDVLVSSYQSGGGGGANIPVDQFSLAFAKIEFSFFPQDEKGKLGSPTKMGWDLRQNKKM